MQLSPHTAQAFHNPFGFFHVTIDASHSEITPNEGGSREAICDITSCHNAALLRLGVPSQRLTKCLCHIIKQWSEQHQNINGGFFGET